MIRLIATDLDGTLLDPAGNLPGGTFRTIEKLHEKGLLFCAASGRQLVALRQMFAPVADKMLFLAENGAIVSYGQKVLYCHAIRPDDTLRALDAMEALSGVHALLCAPKCAYYADEAQPFLYFVKASYVSNRKADLRKIAQSERICKIAVYDDGGPEKKTMTVLPHALPDMRVTLSGGNWLDISGKNTHKGRAMRFIQKAFRFAREECVAFGDHMNDYEMLIECGHPYVPENAYAPLKKLIGKTVPSNAEGGVMTAMEQLAEGRLP